MICRDVLENGVENFDYFNDAKDTIAWLRGIVANADSGERKQKASNLIVVLQEGYKEYCSNFFNKGTK